MTNIEDLKTKIFSDGADEKSMLEMYAKPFVKGLTTNPTLMRKSGVTNYREFCKNILLKIKDKSISFEVFSDDLAEMERQALEISKWGDNVYVKIPVSNTKQESCYSLIKKLCNKNVKVNVTAVMTIPQVMGVAEVLNPNVPSYLSVFAGRIADTGRDPIPTMTKALEILKPFPAAELIWSSPRELYNIFQANNIGCHIITVSPEILQKISMIGRDLSAVSLDVIEMFYSDARAAGYRL